VESSRLRSKRFQSRILHSLFAFGESRSWKSRRRIKTERPSKRCSLSHTSGLDRLWTGGHSRARKDVSKACTCVGQIESTTFCPSKRATYSWWLSICSDTWKVSHYHWMWVSRKTSYPVLRRYRVLGCPSTRDKCEWRILRQTSGLSEFAYSPKDSLS